ncbi:FKBP-type peptidyl-prolyl cis-trans isomerase N-terminal domain-containing protein [Vibrio sp. ZSDZ34]|uniref:FKBP-type peptidyl-prolyl cis-trans isomerase N-terminal domain-containing protein n=1 Tax=Vibrio gelatinilyticus TaxID=2893468 RepID=A0A9X1WCG8_9VIBR|nr:FKBP-type peptidyl-prolyl cis-trans isomerase N-terminal domain-containing protein [Vibrio gelatinilyticus]MCJ2376880.1 FKBP-type peptidyl-prolyl cis-trans isomerase N-terminal domain-containing protein [Vibrio gelatinilyticus]
MNLKLKVTLLSLSAALLAGCQKDEPLAERIVKSTENEIAVLEERLVPQTREQQQAYALGMTLAARLSMELEVPAELGIEVDENYVLQGITDLFTNNMLITPHASTELLEALVEDIAQTAARLEDNS